MMMFNVFLIMNDLNFSVSKYVFLLDEFFLGLIVLYILMILFLIMGNIFVVFVFVKG